MRAGDFDINEQALSLRDPHCITILHPWINVGNVGRHTLKRLIGLYKAKEVARLTVPGKYYDFTRYRPTLKSMDNKRMVRVPNTIALGARAPEAFTDSPDMIFLSMMEPHMFGEEFNDSIVQFIQALRVTRYVIIGGMYDTVPHTLPLIVTGNARNWEPNEKFKREYLRQSRYQGPTSFSTLLTDRFANDLSLETLSLIVHLPLYLKISDDFTGATKLLSTLAELYHLPSEFPEEQKGKTQYTKIEAAVEKNSKIQEIIRRFEAKYDKQNTFGSEIDPASPPLSRAVEEFLQEISKRNEEDNTGEDV